MWVVFPLLGFNSKSYRERHFEKIEPLENLWGAACSERLSGQLGRQEKKEARGLRGGCLCDAPLTAGALNGKG